MAETQTGHVAGKRLHDRVPLVQRAGRELHEAFLNLCPEGSVIEQVCCDVCDVEKLCLRASDTGLVPAAPVSLSVRAVKLWEAVREKVDEAGLSWGEAARIVHHLSDSWLHYIVRWERHGPDSEKKADEA